MTRDHFMELLAYDSESGLMTWRKSVGGRRAGSVAGRVDHDGYRVVTVVGRGYPAHRLAWLFMTGDWPPNVIDHINGDRADNRWVNLRSATVQQNTTNAKRRKDNTSGFKGISRIAYPSGTVRWRVAIYSRNQYFYLGTYLTEEAAQEAYAVAAKRLHGEFARVG